MKLSVLAASLCLAFSGAVVAGDQKAIDLNLSVIGQYQTGIFDDSAAEIVAHDPRSQRLFAINASKNSVDVLDINDPTNPQLIGTIDATDLGAGANSVAVHKGVVAVAIEADDKQAPGVVAFYDAVDLSLINSVQVGALPDMVTFTPNGKYLLVANEGEPNDDYTVDPEGSISIIELKHGASHAKVRTADFTRFNDHADKLKKRGIRIFGPGATVAQDLEPEYITISKNSKRAWVSLQEANALALVDIRRAKVLKLLPLGTKDHSLPENALDVSNRDDMINIANWPIKGMYQPDAIASYKFRGRTFIVTANEGDSRDYDGFSEEERVGDLPLDETAFPDAATLQENENLGRLKITTVNGDSDGDGDYDEIYSYGARSFSIRNARGKLVYDSADDFERITAEQLPDDFNSNNDENDSFDSRSDDKGPEPEGVALGKIEDRTFAFVGLERVGGIMVYDITNPHRVSFIEYLNNRDFSVDAELPDGSTNPLVGDLGPEGITFIDEDDSPVESPLLVVGNEVSGTTTIYSIDVIEEEDKDKDEEEDEKEDDK
ncbi:MAG: choice-of-anchor I family protein [Candidatus Thiodiazotropha sp. (ex Ctena orbiculata)]|uniref:Choice-of-anchor I family protein n=1 Tax=Candidatus Thiodiazotropha taylori TaxID=2792791 RepID=A0A944QWI3_9GAMM|nr:choice-of-anchor I family protein [Candidatus Thiodiazotropha taylori]MBT3028789.1 choice-of-anchor I family protein [Candidatus Thiodiazotropha taylori]MBT3036828.1 choice-of-anchor I family protein [Candidatus Thiodiazotropha taylori]MBV2136688.1 choice-of-anchor I family protein [Candidatus Thiodiazotropha taylori]PVV14050.1 MAG: alkaline phosphatase [gamma proteobacterium symbiont of Ctena orbiculata]